MPTAKPRARKAAPPHAAAPAEPVSRITPAANSNGPEIRTDDFERALAPVLTHEGGWSNNPADPGGATMRGVTQRTYNQFRLSAGLSSQSVRLMSEAEMKTIYRQRYWDAIKGDQLPSGINYAVFDGAVNSGPGQSVKWLQRALTDEGLYSGQIDGLIGPSTLAAIRLDPNNDQLIVNMEERRLAFMQQLRGWRTFRNGWSSRVAEVKRLGQAWATGAEATPVTFFAGGEAKADILDAAHRPSKAIGDITTGLGSAGTVGGGALTGFADKLQQFSQFELIAKIIAVITVASMVLTALGLGYRWWTKRRELRRADVLDLSVAPGAEVGADAR